MKISKILKSTYLGTPKVKMFGVIALCCVFMVFVGCINTTKKKKSGGKFPIAFDYTKNYPKKDIDLSEIADFEYISFKDKDMLLGGDAGKSGISVSDEYIILDSGKDGTIYVLNRDGSLLNKFNKKGRGNEEYTSISQLTADFKTKEIFVFDIGGRYRILVYSFEGSLKRVLKIPKPFWVNIAVDYDDEYILAHFDVAGSAKELHGDVFKIKKSENPDNRYYYFISKDSGEFTPIDIAPKEVVSNYIKRINRFTKDGMSYVQPVTFKIPDIYPVVKNASEVFISDFGCDTIYINRGDKFTPFIVKSPPVTNYDKPTLVYVKFKTKNYTFIEKVIRDTDDPQWENFVIDNQTGEIFRPNIIGSGWWINLNAFNRSIPQNCIANLHSTFNFVELNEKEKINNVELKEFISTLDAEDNDFLVITKFKD